VTSLSSMISKNIDSVDGGLIYCADEKSTENMTKRIIQILIRELWNGEIGLSFILDEKDITLH